MFIQNTYILHSRTTNAKRQQQQQRWDKTNVDINAGGRTDGRTDGVFHCEWCEVQTDERTRQQQQQRRWPQWSSILSTV